MSHPHRCCGLQCIERRPLAHGQGAAPSRVSAPRSSEFQGGRRPEYPSENRGLTDNGQHDGGAHQRPGVERHEEGCGNGVQEGGSVRTASPPLLAVPDTPSQPPTSPLSIHPLNARDWWQSCSGAPAIEFHELCHPESQVLGGCRGVPHGQQAGHTHAHRHADPVALHAVLRGGCTVARR